MEIERPESRPQIPEDARQVYRGIFYDAYQWPHQLTDGQVTIFERLRRKDIALVIPVTPENNILINKETYPCGTVGYTVPGGVIEAGENPLTAAKRELLEETGYTAQNWELWFATQPDSQIDSAVYVFIGRNCVKVAGQCLDATEEIAVEEISFRDFLFLTGMRTFKRDVVALEVLRATRTLQDRQYLEKLFLEC